MYKVTCKSRNSTANSFIIHDEKSDNNLLSSASISLENGKAGTFVFNVLPTHPYYDVFEIRKHQIDVWQNDSIIFSGIITDMSVGFYAIKKITCEGMMTLLNDTIQRPASLTGTVRSIINTLISNHNEQCTDEDKLTISGLQFLSTTYSLETNMCTTMSALQAIFSEFGGYMRVYRNSTTLALCFEYVETLQNENKQTVRLGYNLMDFSKKTNVDSACSKIIPLGAEIENPTVKGERLTISSVNSDKDWLFTGNNNVGNITKTVIFDDITDATELKTKAQAYISSISAQNICIEVKAFDLSLSNDAFESFKLFDKVRIISAPHDIDAWYPLTKMKIDINQPSKNTITLGDEKNKTISELVK